MGAVEHPNVFSASFAYDPEDPIGYRAAVADVGKAAGGTELIVRLFEIPAGESLCPYHYEYVEEWLILLEGTVLLRTPAGSHAVGAGDVVRFPPGPDGAHKLTNTASAAARALMFSSAAQPAVSVYPDSDKIGVWPGHDPDNVMLLRASGKVDYYEGETSERS
jgi:uncharacterized cupin superfamily protein